MSEESQILKYSSIGYGSITVVRGEKIEKGSVIYFMLNSYGKKKAGYKTDK